MKKIVFFVFMLIMMTVFSVHANAMETTKSKETCLRVVHASPNAPAVDVKVDGQMVLKNVKFKDVSNKLMVTPGKHTVEILPNAVTKDNKSLLSKVLTVEEGKCYTVVAANQAEKLELVVFENVPCKADGNASIRIGHFSPNAPAVDIGLKNKDNVFSGLTFKQVSNLKALPAGTYDLQVRVAGTKNVALDLPGVTVKGNTSYTVLAVGLAGGTPPLSVIVIEDKCQ